MGDFNCTKLSHGIIGQSWLTCKATNGADLEYPSTMTLWVDLTEKFHGLTGGFSSKIDIEAKGLKAYLLGYIDGSPEQDFDYLSSLFIGRCLNISIKTVSRIIDNDIKPSKMGFGLFECTVNFCRD